MVTSPALIGRHIHLDLDVDAERVSTTGTAAQTATGLCCIVVILWGARTRTPSKSSAASNRCLIPCPDSRVLRLR